MTHCFARQSSSQRTSHRSRQVFIMQVHVLESVTNLISDLTARTTIMTSRPCPMMLAIIVAVMVRGRGAAMADRWGFEYGELVLAVGIGRPVQWRLGLG